jgi:RNA polymerase-binding transcription factor DksA
MKPEEFLQLILAGINPNSGEALPKSSPLLNDALHHEIACYLKSHRYDLTIITLKDIEIIEASELFQELKKERLKISRELGWKPYHVLSNNALVRLIIYEPRNIEEASKIKYVGTTKIKYVENFIAIINKFKTTKKNLEKEITKKHIAPEDLLCSDCKKEIDFNRRMAVPDCTRCIECQNKYEYSHDTRTKVRDLPGTLEDIEKMKKDLRGEMASRNR